MRIEHPHRRGFDRDAASRSMSIESEQQLRNISGATVSVNSIIRSANVDLPWSICDDDGKIRISSLG
jgi:hypothetical protein